MIRHVVTTLLMFVLLLFALFGAGLGGYVLRGVIAGRYSGAVVEIEGLIALLIGVVAIGFFASMWQRIVR